MIVCIVQAKQASALFGDSMVEHFDPIAFRAYLARAFPRADLGNHPIDFGPVHLRFELGDRHPNGSDERIAQATERATVLFGDLFLQDEQLTLIIKNWAWTGRELFPKSPGHLASLIRGPASDRFVEIITSRRSHGEEYSYEQVLRRVFVRDLDCRSIFRGIAHVEQGREPCINESVYFVSARRILAFYMYDDRGCLVFADNAEKLRPLYQKRRSWLVDPDNPDWEHMLDSGGVIGG